MPTQNQSTIYNNMTIQQHISIFIWIAATCSSLVWNQITDIVWPHWIPQRSVLSSILYVLHTVDIPSLFTKHWPWVSCMLMMLQTLWMALNKSNRLLQDCRLSLSRTPYLGCLLIDWARTNTLTGKWWYSRQRIITDHVSHRGWTFHAGNSFSWKAENTIEPWYNYYQ